MTESARRATAEGRATSTSTLTVNLPSVKLAPL